VDQLSIDTAFGNFVDDDEKDWRSEMPDLLSRLFLTLHDLITFGTVHVEHDDNGDAKGLVFVDKRAPEAREAFSAALERYINEELEGRLVKTCNCPATYIAEALTCLLTETTSSFVLNNKATKKITFGAMRDIKVILHESPTQATRIRFNIHGDYDVRRLHLITKNWVDNDDQLKKDAKAAKISKDYGKFFHTRIG
jgi:hypothetical protein